tara:strand:- start:7410 stop:7967 length:558 start_codon:yes stop_codon:yes gene_type:complete
MQKKILRHIKSCPVVVLLWLLGGVSGLTAEEQVFQKIDSYVAGMLGTPVPESRTLWVDQDLRDVIGGIIKYPAPLRIPYWQKQDMSVWILNDLGKLYPITAGVTVKGGRIYDISVLIYRESHGAEVRYPAFRKQFEGASLTGDRKLDKTIHGISGATLSTNTMKRLARLALVLDQKITGQTAIGD